jgi:hypothetical protein
MALEGTYDTLKQLFQDIIAPQLEKMSGEISGLKTEVRSLEKRMEEGFASSRNEMESLRGEMRQGLAYTNERLDEVLEIRERLAALEAKLANRN